MEAQVTISKMCVVCGIDVSLKKRVKDPSGRYFCAGCYQTASEDAQRKPAAASVSANPYLAPRTPTPQKAPGADSQAFREPPLAAAPSKPISANRNLRLIAIVASVIVLLGGIVTFKAISDRNAAQSLQKVESDRISAQANDQVEAERLRAEADALREQQAKRDLAAKETEARAKEQAAVAARDDPAKLFEKFSGLYMKEVVNQITTTSYIVKVDTNYKINVSRTNNLLAPVQGVIDGGVLTQLHGQVNDASTPVRLTFAFQDGSWVLGAMETKDVVVGDGPYGREVHVGPWGLCVTLNGFEGFFVKATDRANEAMKK